MSVYTTAVLADSPVEAWFMDESSGTTVASSGSGNHSGTANGGAAVVSSVDGNARSFDGTDDYISAASVADFTAQTNYSVEAWFKIASGDTNGTDWRTIVRRDGTGAWLIRVAGSTSGITQGSVQTYINGKFISTGTTTFNDNNWHHVVVTRASSTYKLYVDGTEYTTTSGTAGSAIGTANAFIIGNAGGAGGSERFKGTLDAVAIYHSALSSTAINTHKNSWGVVNGGYTAQAMTATATTVDATGSGNVVNLAVTHDASPVWNPSTSITGNDTTLNISTIASRVAYVRSAAYGGSEYETARTLYLYRTSTADFSVDVYTVNATWDESTINWSNKPSTTFVRTISGLTGSGWKAIDITGADTGNGVMLVGANAGTFNSSENGSNQPYVLLVTQPQTNVNPSATAVTASALMVDPTVDATDTVSASGQPFTASATLVNASVSTTVGDTTNAGGPLTASAVLTNPTVATEQETVYDADPMTASATWPTTTGISVPVSVSADVWTASATSVDATVSTQRGPRINPGVMGATAYWKAATEVNGSAILASEADDPYFQRVYAATPKFWFRLNGAGSVQDDRMHQAELDAYVQGDAIPGRHDAPDNRHSIHFPGGGGWIVQAESYTQDSGSYTGGTLEFSFRTNKANAFLMIGYDALAGTISSTQQPPIEVALKNGRINYKTYNFHLDTVAELTGFTNLADGQWHQVVIRYSNTASDIDDGNIDGLTVYVDGKFEIRRSRIGGNTGHGMFAGFPDYIGSRPNILPGLPLPDLPGSLDFEGDMSEVAYYGYALDVNEIPWHYYLFMGWTPVEANPLEAFAFAPTDAHGRGNQKRALVLWWYNNEDAYDIGGAGFNNKPNMNPILGAKGNWGTYDWEGYKVFSKSIMYASPGVAYRDNVTDYTTIIDLENDVDIKDYDVIFFADWPDESAEFDLLAGAVPYFTEKYERLLSQLRWANDKGIGLMITQPRLAVDLGIVDRVEWAPTYREIRDEPAQGAAAGLYDYGSALHFPWNIAGETGLQGNASVTGSVYNGIPMNTDPAFLSNKALYYGDSHKNDRFRVRALIEGLTDIPSYEYDESIYTEEYDTWGDRVIAMKYLHRLDGLQIGDEFIYHGTDRGWTSQTVSANYDTIRTGRWYGTFAVPMANVKAGTVVTTFGEKQWIGESEVDNPYKNYATTVVLRPGDYLNGTRVGGKIFVNFSEQPNRFPGAVLVQVLPGSVDDDGSATWPALYGPDTALQREWEYSQTRYGVQVTQAPVSHPTYEVVMPDGSLNIVSTTNANEDNLFMTRYSELFDTVAKPHFTMVQRGAWWIGQRPEINEGDVFPSAASITATASMPGATVVAEKDADYTAQPMRAIAQVTRVAEDTTGDVEIVPLAMEATATFTNYSKVVSAAPMTATAVLVESFDFVHTTGEQVVLTLHGLDEITLYLKEEE